MRRVTYMIGVAVLTLLLTFPVVCLSEIGDSPVVCLFEMGTGSARR